jgi:hypothetical protein
MTGVVNTFDIGDRVVLEVVLTDAGGATVDPDTVVLRVRSASGQVTTPAVSRLKRGSYRGEVVPATAGDWHWRFETSSPWEGAEEGMFRVRLSKVLS